MRYLVLILALFALSCENSRSVRPDDANDEIGDSLVVDEAADVDVSDTEIGEDDLLADTATDDDSLLTDGEVPDDAPCIDGETQCIDSATIRYCHIGVWGSFDCLAQCKGLGYTQSVGCGYSSNAGKDSCFCE